MMAVVALLASCGGGPDGPDDGPGGNAAYQWSTSDIIMEMTMHSSSNELTSGVKRFYAGDEVSAMDDVDNDIDTRNEAAVTDSKVNVTYTYVGTQQESANAWGANVGRILSEVQTGGTLAPDIYVNFAYDITCASIRGCFANLMTTDTSVYEYGNWFRFVQTDYNPGMSSYFDATAGEGYFWEYMKSLSLTPDTKLYALGSNYTMDLVRAFYVVPVNVTLMNSITEINKAPAGDQDLDGDHDIKDFYSFVWANGWDYDALAAYSAAIYKNDNNQVATADIKDTLGFVLGTGSGLTGSGVLYTTDVEILHKNETTGKYEYPTSSPKLVALATNLNNLFQNGMNSGIATVTREEAVAAGVISSTQTELEAIRTRFAQDKVLFGGIICVGSLEDQVYQDMRATNGFGIVPVPLYQDHSVAGDEYLTSIHNIARIAAISAASTEKSQCTAFLNYQSTHSAEILEQYYTDILAAKVGGVAGDANKQMLTYIRNHVRTCFDKTFEDAIANYIADTNSNSMEQRWHHILMTNNYKISNMSTMYQELYADKQGGLDEIYTQWNTIN